MLTGIKDLDREIVNNLNDKDLLNMCSLNKTYWERVCSDDYFRLRTEKRFPETVPYKDYLRDYLNEQKTRKGRTERTERTERTWKTHYLTIVKYIDILKYKFQYIYKPEDKSPELLYYSIRIVPSYLVYNKSLGLRIASKNGILPVVKYLTENGANISDRNNEALRDASENAHLPVVKYLVEHGADITAQNNAALRVASQNGHLTVVKYLHQNGANINDRNNEAVRVASLNGRLNIVKYLTEQGADITALNNLALRWASAEGHLSVVKYLVEHGADIHHRNNEALRYAREKDVIDYLTSLK